MFVTISSATSSTEMESCPGTTSVSLRRLLNAICCSELEEVTALSTRSLLITLPRRGLSLLQAPALANDSLQWAKNHTINDDSKYDNDQHDGEHQRSIDVVASVL